MSGTPAQKWARERNWSKAQIKGMIASLKSMKGLSPFEYVLVEDALVELRYMIKIWDTETQASKKRHLGVH
jgi:hypothetical protein